MRPITFIAATAVLLGANSANAATVPASIVLTQGDVPAGENEVVTLLNPPTTDGHGAVGFVGRLGLSDYFIWYDGQIIWRNSDEKDEILGVAEATMGNAGKNGFIYSPKVSGSDSVWTQNGLLAIENVQAPGFPQGTNSTFHSRPMMTPGGTAYWISGFNENGGTSTEGRMLYRAPAADPDLIEVVLRADDLIGGLAIDRPSGIGLDFQISDDGNHHIHDLLLDTGGSVDDGAVYVDGVLVARENSPNGDGDNWDNFDLMAINNGGNYMFSGDGDGDSSSDEYLVYNAEIQLREGDTVDGITLANSARIDGLSLSNAGAAVHLWSYAGGNEVLLYTCDAADLANSKVVLQRGDELDLDDDGV
ncbi:MAG TPA: hypothetical protein ENJ18_18235, partial [Nannocystis exedens]|nr:hypothetical protein [Nannocystis exedens]